MDVISFAYQSISSKFCLQLSVNDTHLFNDDLQLKCTKLSTSNRCNRSGLFCLLVDKLEGKARGDSRGLKGGGGKRLPYWKIIKTAAAGVIYNRADKGVIAVIDQQHNEA